MVGRTSEKPSLMKIVAFFQLNEVRWVLPENELAALQRDFPTVTWVSLDDDSRLAKELPDADAFVGWHFPPVLFGRAKALRWIHSASAGIEANLFPALVASDVMLSNSAGLHVVAIPEHVLATMLVLARNFPAAFRNQQARSWDRFAIIAGNGGIRELSGSRLAILGAGPIGMALAQKTAALGMHVRVMRRHAQRAVAGAEAVVGPDGLHELLHWADFVVLAVPLTSETRHLIGAGELRAMRSDAFLINIARGDVVDEVALIDALRSGAIAGAGLDVFSSEPLPESSPLWGLPNVVLTPHVSGYTPDYFGKMLAIFRENVGRFLRGERLRNLVDKQLGYATTDA
jgi:phosphoglycerate dehydrogenase-like enzyme